MMVGAQYLSPLPMMLGDYRVDSFVGGGGMSEVYKAYYLRLGRFVALKTMRPDADPHLLERLEIEAKACASLSHPGIITIHDFFDIQGRPFISMELLEGESLEKAMYRGAMRLERRIEILMAVLEALEHAHTHRVVHRDVKPSNIHILPDGKVKLLDFGLAHVARERSLTLTGTVMGTPHYMSPEQLRAEDVDERTDIYSVGIVAYELLTDRKPFPGGTFTAVMLKALNEPTPPMNTKWSEAFPELEHIVSRATSKAASDRFASAAEMRDALSSFLSQSIGAIRRAETETSELSKTMEREAQVLIADGRGDEAEALLKKFVSTYPSAYDARELLNTVVRPPRAPQQASDESQPSRHDVSVSSPIRQRFGRLSAAAAIGIVVLVAALIVRAAWNDSSDGSVAVANEPSPSPSPAGSGVAVPPLPAPIDRSPAAVPAPPLRVGPRPPAPGDAPLADGSSPTTRPRPTISTPTPRPTAKALFFAPGGAETVAQPGLQYRILRVRGDGQEEEVDPVTVFRSGDRIRLSLQSNIDGHLYIIQRGASGNWALLFPNAGINEGRNAVSAFRDYMVPPGQNAFRFDNQAGMEQLFVVLSRNGLAVLPSFVPPNAAGPPIQQAVVQDLQTSLKPRDLVLERVANTTSAGEAGNFVINNDAGADAVTVSIELTHR